MEDWGNLDFAARDEAILNRMVERNVDPDLFLSSLHDLADAWAEHATSRLRALTRPHEADASPKRAEAALLAINALCTDLGLPPYSTGVHGDALETAHAMVMQSYARR